jgi:iron(III) transport system permease protein
MTAPFATSSLLPPTTARQDARWQRLCRGWSRDQLLQLILLALGIALLTGGLLLPLLTMLQESLQNENGLWVGLANFSAYFDSPHLGRTIGNTLWLGVLITALVVTIAFGYAYALTRTCMPGTPLVWQSGDRQGAARRREHLRSHRHRHWSGLLVLPPRPDDPYHGARSERRPPL